MGLFRCLSLPNVLFLSNVIALGGDVSKKKHNLSMWPGTCLDGCVVFPSVWSSVVLWYFCVSFFLKVLHNSWCKSCGTSVRGFGE